MFASIYLSLLAVCSVLGRYPPMYRIGFTDAMLHLHRFSTAIFMLTAFLNLLNACLHPSRGLAAQDFLHLLVLILSIFLMKELTSIFTLSSLTLVNSGTLFLWRFSTCLWLELFQKRSVKTPLMLTWPAPLAFIHPTVLLTRSGDNPDFF